MYKYRYLFYGDFFGKLHKDQDYYDFQIEVTIPIDYNTRNEAIHCPCSLQFEKENGHAVLHIYSNWLQGKNKKGNWFEHVEGEIIETIQWQEHWKYKISRSKVFSKDMGGFVDACKDYLPDATPWDELFDIENQPDDWKNTVESLAYSINIIEVEK